MLGTKGTAKQIKMKQKYDFKDNEYTAKARIKPAQWDWIKQNKGKRKSAAAFLEEIIEEYNKPNLFKKGK